VVRICFWTNAIPSLKEKDVVTSSTAPAAKAAIISFGDLDDAVMIGSLREVPRDDFVLNHKSDGMGEASEAEA
jgi:hypothetical protein